MKSQRAYIGIGSNLGDRIANCRRAIAAVSRLSGVTAAVASSLYETAPVLPARGSWFVNGVASVETTLPPKGLFRELQRIEQDMGRPADRERGEDRRIDLDLLLVGSRIIGRPDLILPHPRLHLRRFVLVPLCEIEPDLRHPVLGVTMRELLDRLDDPSAVRLLLREVLPAPTG